MDRLLRFESVIAICALLISAISAAAMLYQTRVIENQYAAAIWPYLSVDTTFDPTSMRVVIANDGLGPALIRSAQLHIDGKPVDSWTTYFKSLVHAHPARKHSYIRSEAGSLDASSTIRPGEDRQLLFLKLGPGIPESVLREHVMAVDICYCSLNDVCWMLHSIPGHAANNYPQRRPSCAVGPRIS